MQIGFPGLLGLLFIGLKLGGVIDWSWWWVLLPIYGPLAVALVVFCVAVAGHLWLRRDPVYQAQRALNDMAKALRRR